MSTRTVQRVATTAAALVVVGAALAAPTASAGQSAGQRSRLGVTADAVTTAAATTSTGGTYSFLSTWKGKPVRWDPCSTIRYRINRNGAAPWAEVSAVRSSFAALGKAMGGVRFVYAGATSVVPDTSDDAKRSGANIVVAFASPGSGARKSSMLTGREAGRGGFGSTSWTGGDGAHVPIAKVGAVVVDARKLGQMTRKTRNALYQHEIGHVLGLGHASDRRQLMYPTLLTSGPRTYASGDLTGLRQLGRQAGCLQVPAKPAAPAIRVSGDNVVISVPAVRSVSGTPRYRLNSHHVLSLNGKESASPTFTVRRTAVGIGATFSISAVNRVGQSTGGTATFRG